MTFEMSWLRFKHTPHNAVAINAQIKADFDNNLADYIWVEDDLGEVNDIRVSARYDIDVGKVIGVITVESEPLSHWKLQKLLEFIAGQLSDGWGETFEQQSVLDTADEFFVEFWSDHPHWRLSLVSIDGELDLKMVPGRELKPGDMIKVFEEEIEDRKQDIKEVEQYLFG